MSLCFLTWLREEGIAFLMVIHQHRTSWWNCDLIYHIELENNKSCLPVFFNFYDLASRLYFHVVETSMLVYFVWGNIGTLF